MSTIAILFLVLIICGVGIAIAILFLLTFSRTLQLIDVENRTMEPGQIWLLLIPIFNIYWIFAVAKNVSSSIQNQFQSRGVPVEPKPTYSAGMAYASASLLSTVLSLFALFQTSGMEMINGIVNLAGVVAWIVYWSSVANYKKQLSQLPPKQDSMIFNNIPVQY